MALIEFRAVSKRFQGKKKGEVDALKNVNLSIEKGDIFGVIGLSGAGKSTLLRCLTGLDKPTSGQIFVNNKEITTLNDKALRPYRREMGLIFQHFNLFSSRTVKENIAFPLEIASLKKEERVDELLRLVSLENKGDNYPAELSGGQKQRVGIARALSNNPHILLCDEATSALDPKTTNEILTLLKELKHKFHLTIVLITHEMEVVKKICNKVAVLEQGEVVETGTLAEIFTEPKHPTTKKLVQKTIHDIPLHLLSGKGKVFHLHFQGTKAEQPIISQMIKRFDVDANILLGWIDCLQKVTIGNLVIELTGKNIAEAIRFLEEHQIIVEEVKHGRE